MLRSPDVSVAVGHSCVDTFTPPDGVEEEPCFAPESSALNPPEWA
jgi:hypothetical protein